MPDDESLYEWGPPPDEVCVLKDGLLGLDPAKLLIDEFAARIRAMNGGGAA